MRTVWSTLTFCLAGTFCLAFATAITAQEGPTQIGESIPWDASSPEIKSIASSKGAEPAWTETLTFPEASYIAPHFAHFDLPEGARVVVRAPKEGLRSWGYEGAGNGDLGLKEGFWGIHIPGDTAIVELWTSVPVRADAVVIDQFASGFGDGGGDGDTEALCGTDDSQWAPCYQTTEPSVYNKSRAVARLVINGTNACTGWLVGNSGHLMTNEHCIGSVSDAFNTNYEFMAEGATCGTNCATGLGCPGTVVATSATLIQLNVGLDYALLQLPTNPTAIYGFLQLRNRGTHAGERIYIPQHPLAWGKRIALHSTHADDETGFCQVESTTRSACTGGPVDDIGYFCDTQGGSSGSPVLGYCDNQVVALHHCANCPNRAVPIEAIISDLGANLPPGAVGSSWGCGDCGPGYCNDSDEYCDVGGCYPATSPISRIACDCGLLDPTCGFGGCVGGAYCEGPNCQFPVCYSQGSPWSQVMCEGWELDASCTPVP